MGTDYSPKIVTQGLVFCVDAGNPKSYSGTGTVITDFVSQTVGETVNAPVFNTGKGGYFSFVTNKFIRLPEINSLNTQTVSVEVWMRTNATSQAGMLFEKGRVNTQYNLFQDASALRWRANLGAGHVNMVTITTASFVNTTDWFHLVSTFISGQQYIYINAVEVGSGTTTGTLQTNTNGVSIGTYGGYNGSRGYYYNGDIGSVRVYNKVLSLQEVQRNFQAFRRRFGL